MNSPSTGPTPAGAAFSTLRRSRSGFDLGEFGTTRYLIGADGPRSRVARAVATSG